MPAKERYMASDLFKAQRRYAENHPDLTTWKILSAKYGLISPTKRIKHYDREMSEGFPPAVAELIQEVIDNFFANLPDGMLVEILAGGDYLQRLEWYLDHYDIEYTIPFENQRLAVRTKNMKIQAREWENNSLTRYAP